MSPAGSFSLEKAAMTHPSPISEENGAAVAAESDAAAPAGVAMARPWRPEVGVPRAVSQAAGPDPRRSPISRCEQRGLNYRGERRDRSGKVGLNSAMWKPSSFGKRPAAT